MAAKQPGVWGIDLGQCALKAVRFELIEGKVTATAFDFIEHPKILSQPDADPDELTRQALEQFLKRNDLKGDMVAIGVPGQSGLARFVKLPPVEEKKIDDIVQFEAKQQIPFPLEEVIWDYQPLGKTGISEEFVETEIGLFAMKRDMVNRALQQFSDVNVEVHFVQMAPLALVNFVTYELLKKNADGKTEGAQEEEEPKGDKECVVALDIGAETSNLVITDGDRVIWQRAIPIGGNRFTRDLTRELKLTFAKAEHVKRNAAKSQDLRKILLALRPGLNEFVNEVQRSLGYFMNTHRGTSVKYMVGLGNAFRLPGLQKFLQEKLQLEVRKLPKLDRLTGDVLTEPQFRENILSFGVACGLALQGLDLSRITTNLLPSEIRFARMVREKKPWAVATAAALLLAIASYTFGHSVTDGIYNKEINKPLEDALKRGETVSTEANGITSALQDFEEKIKKSEVTVDRIAAGVKQRYNWNLIYKYINDCRPQPDPSWPPNPRRVKVAARSYDGEPAFNMYVNKEAARDAAIMWRQKLSASPEDQMDDVKVKELEKKEAQKEAFIKKNMIQVNIEGVNCLYSDDLSKFFDNLKDLSNTNMEGMRDAEAKKVKGKEGLPQKGWVYEIRGYTYWQPRKTDIPYYFVARTLVHNLAHPKSVGVQVPSDALEKKIIEFKKEGNKEVLTNPSYFVLYKQEVVKNPVEGKLKLASHSHLKEVMGAVKTGGDGPGTGGTPGGSPPGGGTGQTGDTTTASPRQSWLPVGDIATAVLGGGVVTDGKGGTGDGPAGGAGTGGGNAPPAPAAKDEELNPARTEFIIFFIWQEPTLDDQSAEAASTTE